MNTPHKLGHIPFDLTPEIDEAETQRYVDMLGGLQERLVDKMSQLNDKDILQWHSHTDKNDLFGLVTEHVIKTYTPQLCTRAWCKFYEILQAFELLPEEGCVKTFHLCEAPGGFITALNHFLACRLPRLNWSWHASTLNPYYEGNSLATMTGDDRFIACTLDRWVFGRSSTGNVLEKDFLETIKAHYANTCDLVTADGSIDCAQNPAAQELTVFPIVFSEIVASINLLKPGGHLVVKKFTNYHNPTIGILFTLTKIFKEVSFIFLSLSIALLRPNRSMLHYSTLLQLTLHRYGIK